MVVVIIKDLAIEDAIGAVVSGTLTTDEISNRIDKIDFETEDDRMVLIAAEFAGEDETDVVVMAEDVSEYFC